MQHFLNHFLKDASKIYCKNISANLIGKKLVLMGWVQNQRDHGHFSFFDLKDKTGIVQIFLSDSILKKISTHSVIAVKGILRKRPEGTENKKLKTGLFELKAEEIKILSKAEALPVDLEKSLGSVQLKYRYLFLRSKHLQRCLKLRDQIGSVVRQVLQDENFLEIETPILYKTTPEGARDYLVPSRIHPGKFYCLVQSPQILKQLLMVGGVDRYFQFAKCFRDEDLRSDRQPEFTQIDLEMSFVDACDVMALNEKLVRALWKKIKNVDVPKIKVLSYEKALEDYGCDHPDLRIPLKLKSLDHWKKSNIQIFSQNEKIKSLNLPAHDMWSRSTLDRLIKEVKALGAQGLIYLVEENGAIKSPLPVDQKTLKSLFKEAGGEKNGLVLIIAGKSSIVNTCFAFLIPHLAKKLSLINSSKDEFVWIVDFPLFQMEEGRITSSHHPFTAPDSEMSEEELIEKLMMCAQNPDLLSQFKFKSKSYDLVCNGNEIAGGSIRNHQYKLQSALFEILSLNKNSAFHFFVEALKYGAPPHGGIAWGLDRLVMTLSGTEDIRDVIAFPKTLQAVCLMSGAPSTVSEERLVELGLSLKKGIK